MMRFFQQTIRTIRHGSRFFQTALLVGGIGAFVTAGEPARDFLTALRDAGYFEEAIFYLDQIAATNDPNVPVDFKARLGYERGRTLLIGASLKRDPVLRGKDYDAAKQSLQKFIEEHPNDLVALNARSQVGQITMLRGVILVEKSKTSPDKKKELMADATAQFQEAIKVFTEIHETLKANPDGGVPKIFDAKKNPQLEEKRTRWREDYVTTLRLIPETRERLANTLEPGTKEHTAIMQQTAKEFEELYKKYDDKLIGFVARAAQARCLSKIKLTDEKAAAKNHTEVTTILDEVMKMEDPDPDVRSVIAGAYTIASKIWNEKKQFNETYTKGHAWLDAARPNELLTEDAQELRLQVGIAAIQVANALKAKTPSAKAVNEAFRQGFLYVSAAQKMGPPWKQRAEEIIPQFPKGTATSAAESGAPKNFDKAFELATETMQSINPATLTVKMMKPRLAKETDAKVKAELTEQIKAAEETIKNAKPQALKQFAQALRMANADSEEAKVDGAIYYLCYLNYDAGNYYDAIALGEYLSMRKPESAGARPAALLAMAACQQLYAADKAGAREFETAHIQSIASYIVEKWPKEKEAGDALNTLFPFLAKAGKFDELKKYVVNIDPESPQRAMVELKMGQVLWANYVNGMKQVRELQNEIKTGARDEATVNKEITDLKANLEPAKGSALETLKLGVDRMRKADQVNPTVVNAVLALTQIYTDTDKVPEAILLLEDAKLGPLTLLNAKSDAVNTPGIPEEIYKTALRCYISSLATSKEGEKVLANAKKIMEGLKTSLGASAEGQTRLVQNYLQIARDLQTQLDLASSEDARKNLAKGFQIFLDEVAKTSSEFGIQNWIAETYKRMGDSFPRDKDNKLDSQAKEYYAKALAGYQRILETAEKDEKFLPNPQIKLSLQRQLASGYKDIGQYEDAAKLYLEVLTKSPGFINVQMEAAYNYQAWGGDPSKEDNYRKYENAILGSSFTGASPIWGWQNTAKKLVGNDSYAQQYYECRYNLSYSRFKYGMAQAKDAEKKKKLIGMTQTEIGITFKLNPEMGGPQWKAKFDGLLKNVQKELGVPIVGLKPLEEAAAAAAAAEKAAEEKAAATAPPAETASTEK